MIGPAERAVPRTATAAVRMAGFRAAARCAYLDIQGPLAAAAKAVVDLAVSLRGMLHPVELQAQQPDDQQQPGQ